MWGQLGGDLFRDLSRISSRLRRLWNHWRREVFSLCKVEYWQVSPLRNWSIFHFRFEISVEKWYLVDFQVLEIAYERLRTFLCVWVIAGSLCGARVAKEERHVIIHSSTIFGSKFSRTSLLSVARQQPLKLSRPNLHNLKTTSFGEKEIWFLIDEKLCSWAQTLFLARCWDLAPFDWHVSWKYLRH